MRFQKCTTSDNTGFAAHGVYSEEHRRVYPNHLGFTNSGNVRRNFCHDKETKVMNARSINKIIILGVLSLLYSLSLFADAPYVYGGVGANLFLSRGFFYFTPFSSFCLNLNIHSSFLNYQWITPLFCV